MTDALIDGINNVFLLFFVMILVRCLLSWIPTFDWSRQPWRTIREVTDAYLDIFRRIIPPVGGLDLSPIFAIIVLQVVNYLIIYILKVFD